MNHTVEQIPERAAQLARLRQEAGRPGVVEITLGAGGLGIDDLKAYADAGVARALVKPFRSTKDAVEGIRRFADEVLPAIRDYPVAQSFVTGGTDRPEVGPPVGSGVRLICRAHRSRL